MKKQEEIVVYWAPSFDTPQYANTDMYNPNSVVYPSWNILYKDPVNSLEELKSRRNKEAKEESYLYCPAVADLHKNTFIFYNTVEGHWKWDRERQVMVSQKNESIIGSVLRPPSLKNSLIFSYSMFHIFFCEEDLAIEATSPYFHKTSYSQYGTFMNGTFNIGAWYREVNADFQLWEGVDEFKLEKNDPLFYIKFNTDKKVVLKRYKITREIQSISTSCRDFRFTFGKFTTWEQKYNQFKMTKTNKILLKLIKENLIDE